MANILHVCNSFDPAGDVTRCFKELNKYSKHEHQLFVKKHHPMQEQFKYEENLQYIGNTISAEDVIIFSDWADAVLYHFVGPEDGYVFPGKPWGFRNATAYYNFTKDKFFATYDTTAKDLTKFHLIATNHMGAADFLSLYGSTVSFLPSMLPLESPDYLPNWDDRSPCVSIIKYPDKFYNANYVGGPSRQYLYGNSHKQILNIRRLHASVVIDNTTEGHYGLAGLEAMALGLPAVVFNHNKTWDQLDDITEEVPPGFIEVSHDADVSNAVNYHMNLSPKERMKIREWMDSYYHSRRLIDKFWDPFVDKLLEAECNL